MAKTIEDLANEMSALADAINRNTAATDAERKQLEKDELEMSRFEGKAGSMFDRQTTLNKRSWQDKRKKKFINSLKNNDKADAQKIIKGTKAANYAGMIAGVATDAAKKIADFVVKMKEFEIKEQNIKLQAAAKSMEVQNALYGSAISKAVSIGANTLVGDIKDSTYSAMENVMELGKQNLTSTIELSRIQFDKETDLNINAIQKKAAQVGAVADTVSGVLEAIPNPYTMVIGSAVSIANSIFQASAEIDIKKAEFAKEAKSVLSNFQKDIIDKTYEAVKPILDLTKSVDKLLMELDNNAHIVGRGFGFYGRQLDNYINASSKLNLDMAEMGKTFEDLKKSQEAYVSASGRNLLMNGKEGQQLSSLDTLFNLGDNETAQLMGAMNIFNTSIESGSDMMFEMYKTANKMGVSNQKFAKDLQKNLKLAEKYQFKGGVEGMMKMSLWAQKVRFNMDSLSAALDKMHTGNIEDVIQTSARLNVLGGNAGLLSDPMAMLYNAYADPEQYAKNMQQMVAGFGHFNSKTGETEFNINEQMRMEAMASAMGVSKEEFFNMARQTKKEGVLKKEFGNRFDQDQMDLLTQHATYDRKNKEWVVNVVGKNGEVEQKSVNDLNDDDLKSIFPEDTQEQLVEYTKGIYSLLQEQHVVEATNKAEIMDRTQKTHKTETLRQHGITASHYENNMDAYTKEIQKGFRFSTNSLEASLQMTEELLNNIDENGSLTDKYYKASLTSVQQISGQIVTFQDAMGNMLENNFQAVLDAMAVLNPDAAAEFQAGSLYSEIQAMKNADKVEDYESVLGRRVGMSGSKAYDIVKKMNYDVDEMNGIYGRTDDDRMMASMLADPEVYGHKINGVEYIFRHGAAILDDNNQMLKVPREFVGKLKRANDLIISPKHGIFQLDPEDTITASKPGGSLDRAEQRINRSPENLNLTVNGTLTLSTGKQSIDLLDVLRNDPNALRELAKEIIVEGSRTTFGGKHQWAPNRYTFGN